MAESKLQRPELLRDACEGIEKDWASGSHRAQWLRNIADFINWFREASEPERASEAFQRKLWDENPVAAVGQGNIDITPVIEDPEFRRWIAVELGRKLDGDITSRRSHIEAIVKRLRAEFQERLPRTPQLKMFRVLAIAFPHDFSTVADGRRVRALHRELVQGRRMRPLLCNFEIMDRLNEVLGPSGEEPIELAQRMALPWMLYERYILSSDEEATEEIVRPDGETRLIPIPAPRRRRGLTVIANGLQTVLGALDFIEDGVEKGDLIAHLRTLLPNYKDSSLNVTINVLRAELGLVRSNKGHFTLTDRGQALLETQDPSELSDWLLTRVLGVDMTLATLRDEGPQAKGDLQAKVKSCNPGWTTNFAPSAILSWLRSLSVIEDSDGVTDLTETGRQWAERIHWQPAVLKPEPTTKSVPVDEKAYSTSHQTIQLPGNEMLIASIQSEGHFEARLIRNLHAGLWSDHQRHFAVLTGLSGTGKTLLARAYGDAVGKDGGGVYQLSVQPGWYDAGSILGYVNPLRPDTYTRTGFLEFLMQAVDNPELPHVVILDEMNLSHPEQYLAPILSAMESKDGQIALHQEGEDFDGVPPWLPYPSNLVLIGTVNMDETTHGLSDKVLDRAFTIEFWDVDIGAYPGWQKSDLDSVVLEQTRTVLEDLYSALRPARLHFGWRTIADVLGFLRASQTGSDASDLTDRLDSIIYAKVLPKLRGDDSPRFRSALEEAHSVLTRHHLRDSADRVHEMSEDLVSMGTARFWR